MRSAPHKSLYLRVIKPFIDFLFAVVLTVVLLPLFLLTCVLLYFANGGKVFFRQRRIGENEKSFIAWKFKTMNDATASDGRSLPDEERLTKIGRILRKTSLDEIPQLFNILKGDMSFIGPRPLIPEYLAFYDPVQRQRHLVRPGITGLAQVNGRNLTTWEKRFEMDVFYVANASLALDIRIFLRTIVIVLTAKGISAEGHATMPKFSDHVKAKSLK